MVNIFLFLQTNIGDPSALTAQYEGLVQRWITNVTPYADELFYALAFLDLAVFGWTLIRQHGMDIHGAILSTVNRIVLIGAFLALLLNGQDWMNRIINMFIQVGKAGSGVPALYPSVILQQGIQIGFALFAQAVLAGAMTNIFVSIAMTIAAVAIVGSFLTITVEFVVTKIQTFLALGMGFFFLAFGGSGWTRNYVERYFAYAVGSGVRLMANYFLIGAGLAFAAQWQIQAAQAPWSLDGIKAAWVIACGAILYAVICWKGSAIASQLLGGGPNLSHSDVFSAMGMAASAAASAVMVGSLATGMLPAAAGAGAIAGAGGASGAASGGAGASAAASTATPASKPPSSSSSNGSGGGGGARLASSAASAVGGALRGVGSAGSHQVHPPQFRGFES